MVNNNSNISLKGLNSQTETVYQGFKKISPYLREHIHRSDLQGIFQENS